MVGASIIGNNVIIKWFNWLLSKFGAIKADREEVKRTQQLYEKYQKWSKEDEKNENEIGD